MEQSLVVLRDICHHAWDRLETRPSDRDALADVATVVYLVSARLHQWTAKRAPRDGENRRVQASDMALTAIDRRLAWLSQDGAGVSDDIMRRTVERTLNLVMQVVAVLQRATPSISPA